jgi:hypothetical protein
MNAASYRRGKGGGSCKLKMKDSELHCWQKRDILDREFCGHFIPILTEWQVENLEVWLRYLAANNDRLPLLYPLPGIGLVNGMTILPAVPTMYDLEPSIDYSCLSELLR